MLSETIAALLLLAGSFLASLYMIPRIRGVVKFKKFMREPDSRSSHKKITPSLGGIAFFTILMVAFYFIHPYDTYNEIMAFVPGITVLFIAGMKDDLVVLGPFSKLITQITAALFLVFHYKFSIESLHGFMGIDSMPSWLGGIIAVLIVISVINAVNLIDGIDGLAATVGIIMFSGFAIIFYLADKHMLMLTSAVMTGILAGYLPFNLSRKRKIFMGDTGSLLLGFMLGGMAVRMLAFDQTILIKLPFNHENLPWVVASLLIIPLFDTARVFTIRLLNNRSPFKPDRNHIHHVIIDFFGISHRRASFFIGLGNFLFALLFSVLAMRVNQWTLLIVFSLAIVSAVVFFFILKRRHMLNINPNKVQNKPVSLSTSYATEHPD
jgi:UDP-N-acetylmuramyl pentapeptide phosphotransferase/UDP-N-acetylglucosamine-1-phosphate transferase